MQGMKSNWKRKREYGVVDKRGHMHVGKMKSNGHRKDTEGEKRGVCGGRAGGRDGECVIGCVHFVHLI